MPPKTKKSKSGDGGSGGNDNFDQISIAVGQQSTSQQQQQQQHPPTFAAVPATAPATGKPAPAVNNPLLAALPAQKQPSTTTVEVKEGEDILEDASRYCPLPYARANWFKALTLEQRCRYIYACQTVALLASTAVMIVAFGAWEARWALWVIEFTAGVSIVAQLVAIAAIVAVRRRHITGIKAAYYVQFIIAVLYVTICIVCLSFGSETLDTTIDNRWLRLSTQEQESEWRGDKSNLRSFVIDEFRRVGIAAAVAIVFTLAAMWICYRHKRLMRRQQAAHSQDTRAQVKYEERLKDRQAAAQDFHAGIEIEEMEGVLAQQRSEQRQQQQRQERGRASSKGEDNGKKKQKSKAAGSSGDGTASKKQEKEKSSIFNLMN
jgi:uncharacterized membrane protein YhaH (DUF805 family)